MMSLLKNKAVPEKIKSVLEDIKKEEAKKHLLAENAWYIADELDNTAAYFTTMEEKASKAAEAAAAAENIKSTKMKVIKRTKIAAEKAAKKTKEMAKKAKTSAEKAWKKAEAATNAAAKAAPDETKAELAAAAAIYIEPSNDEIRKDELRVAENNILADNTAAAAASSMVIIPFDEAVKKANALKYNETIKYNEEQQEAEKESVWAQQQDELYDKWERGETDQEDEEYVSWFKGGLLRYKNYTRKNKKRTRKQNKKKGKKTRVHRITRYKH